MSNLKEYINEVIGLYVTIKPFEMIGQLPLYLIESYEFSIIQIEQKELLILTLKNNDNFTVGQLEKHRQNIKNLFNLTVVFVFNQLEAFNRKRLVEQKIGFIVPFKQLYIPEFLLDFRETGLTIKTKTKQLTPTAQLLVLLTILDKYNRKKTEALSFKELASLINVKPMEITRAVTNLNDLDLIEIHGTKDKCIQFKLERNELWHHAINENIFINPIARTFYTATLPNKCVLKSNASALPEYTDMNPSKQDYYALDKNDYATLKNDPDFNSNLFEDRYCIEIWKYNPSLLSEIAEPEEHVIDPLSLYLSLRDEQDERIEMALEQIIEKFIW
jgi:hypothetical protein